MANSPGYKALLIRADAREAVDRAKQAHAKQTGVDLNYSQFVKMVFTEYLNKLGGDDGNKVVDGN